MTYENETIKRMSVFILNKLNLFIQGRISQEELFLYKQLIGATLRILNMQEPNRETIEYLDFSKYIVLIQNLEEKLIDIQELKEQLHGYRLMAICGDMLDCMQNKPTETDFSTRAYTPSKKTIYIDFNTLGKIEKQLKDSNFIYDKKNYEFIYSPNHLEEVYRMNIDDYRDMRIHTITVLTNNNVILPLNNKLSFYTEDPNYSYHRVINNLKISELVEEKRKLDVERRNIFFPKNQDLSKTINNAADVFAVIPKESITFKTEKFKNLDELRNCIYSMYQIFDDYGYYVDKKERTIKSSAYDIEHLIYATKCDYFVTDDKKCFKRAEQIFKKIKCNTKILKYDELCNMVTIKQ